MVRWCDGASDGAKVRWFDGAGLPLALPVCSAKRRPAEHADEIAVPEMSRVPEVPGVRFRKAPPLTAALET